MTIKQQGGVFGRNPTFNDVTIDGTLTFNGDIDIDSDLKVSGDLDVTGAANLASLNVSKETGTATPDPTQITIATESSGSGWSTTDPWGRLAFYNSDGSGGGPKIHATIDTIARSSSGAYSRVSFKTSDASSDTLTEVLRFEPFEKNVVVSNGNLVIETSGQGIDFSATAGTGTSELFDDYEEGAWTPALAGSSTAGSFTYTTQNGVYTKIGNIVIASANVKVASVSTSAAGFARLTGGPFTSNGTATSSSATTATVAFANSYVSATMRSSGSTEVIFYDVGTAGLTTLDASLIVANSVFRVTTVYYTG